MTQYARPDDDDGIGSWCDSEEMCADLFSFVNGETAGVDDKYIYLDFSMMDFTPVKFELDSISDPETSVDASHKVYYRCKADGGGPGMSGGSMQAKLYVGANATEVATDPTVHECPDNDSWETFYWPLTPSQANAIGNDYSDLRISLTPSDPNDVMSNIYCNWVYFQCPDVPAPAATQNGSAFMLFLDT